MFTIIFAAVIVVIFLLDVFVFVPKGVKRLSYEHIFNGDKTGYITQGLKLSITKIKKGQIWRLISSTLLHVGVIHIMGNLAALLCVGLVVEPIIGTAKTAVCYIVSSIISALMMGFIYSFDDGEGASTGIFGLMAVFVLLAIKGGAEFLSGVSWYVYAILGVYFIIGLVLDKTSRREHVTGFIGGLCIGSIVIFLL